MATQILLHSDTIKHDFYDIHINRLSIIDSILVAIIALGPNSRCKKYAINLLLMRVVAALNNEEKSV